MTQRIPDDPKLKAAAMAITAEFGEEGLPLSWRIQEDGTLNVILPSGKKINRPLPAAAAKTASPRSETATTGDALEAPSTPPEAASLKQQPSPKPRTAAKPRRRH